MAVLVGLDVAVGVFVPVKVTVAEGLGFKVGGRVGTVVTRPSGDTVDGSIRGVEFFGPKSIGARLLETNRSLVGPPRKVRTTYTIAMTRGTRSKKSAFLFI